VQVSEPLRVLYFSSLFPSPSQPYRGSFSLRRAQSLIRAGTRVHVVCPIGLQPPLRLGLRPGEAIAWVRDQRSAPLETSVEGVPVLYPRWFWPPKSLIGGLDGHLLHQQVARKVDRLIARFKPDAILASWLPDAAAACLVGRRHRLPVAAIVEGSDLMFLPSTYRWWPQMRSTLNSAQALVFVSEDLRSHAAAVGLSGPTEHVVHNGFDPTLFVPPLRRNEHQEAVVLTVGWHDEVKGHDTLLRAASLLAPRLSRPLRLVLVGEGPLERALVSLAEELGISESVDFLGLRPQSELVGLYQSADVFSLPSLSEGMGCVILEAMGCGTPVVASHVGGIPELLSDDVGILVPPSDTQALATALEVALERSWNHDAIRRHAVENFTWDMTALQLSDIVDQLRLEHPSG
jgi:teichuronic acid biosynthesis glycosyltransferase TuaC